MTNDTQRTRKFTFPNGGHSVRKLAESLKELGDVNVFLIIDEDVRYGERSQVVYFEVDSKYSKVNALALADKIITIGTRFTVKDGGTYTVKQLDGTIETKHHYSLEFHTDFSDIMANPNTYLKEL